MWCLPWECCSLCNTTRTRVQPLSTPAALSVYSFQLDQLAGWGSHMTHVACYHCILFVCWCVLVILGVFLCLSRNWKTPSLDLLWCYFRSNMSVYLSESSNPVKEAFGDFDCMNEILRCAAAAEDGKALSLVHKSSIWVGWLVFSSTSSLHLSPSLSVCTMSHFQPAKDTFQKKASCFSVASHRRSNIQKQTALNSGLCLSPMLKRDPEV